MAVSILATPHVFIVLCGDIVIHKSVVVHCVNVGTESFRALQEDWRYCIRKKLGDRYAMLRLKLSSQ